MFPQQSTEKSASDNAARSAGIAAAVLAGAGLIGIGTVAVRRYRTSRRAAAQTRTPVTPMGDGTAAVTGLDEDRTPSDPRDRIDHSTAYRPAD